MKLLIYLFLSCILSVNIICQIQSGQGQPVQSQDNNTASIIAEISTLNMLNSSLALELQTLITALSEKNTQISDTDKMLNANTRVRDSLKNELRRFQPNNGKQIAPGQKEIQVRINDYDKMIMNNIIGKSNLVKEADSIRKQIDIRSKQLNDTRERIKSLEAKLELERRRQNK